MKKTAKLFMNGRSQAVRLPAEFRFEGKEVYIRRDPETGDLILSARKKQQKTWKEFWEMVAELRAQAPEEFEDFLAERPLNEVTPPRDPFA